MSHLPLEHLQSTSTVTQPGNHLKLTSLAGKSAIWVDVFPIGKGGCPGRNVNLLEVKLLKRPHLTWTPLHPGLVAYWCGSPKLKMCNKILATDSHASLEGVGQPQGITVYRLILNQKCMFDIFCFTGLSALKKSLSWKLCNPPMTWTLSHHVMNSYPVTVVNEGFVPDPWT